MPARGLDLMEGEGARTTFNAAIFALDVVISAGVLLFIGRRLGATGVWLGAIGSALALVAAILMVSLRMDWIGAPVPAPAKGHPPLPISIVIWLNMILWALGAVALAGLIGRILRRPSGDASPGGAA